MTSASPFAPPDLWPNLLQDPPWRKAQPLPPMPEALVWHLPPTPIRRNWAMAESSFSASISQFSNAFEYVSPERWAFTRQAPVQPDWEARAHKALHEGYDKDRIWQSMRALAAERQFPPDWADWPAQHLLLLACGVPAAQVPVVAQKAISEASDFSEPRCAHHHHFDHALPNHLVLGYWEAFGQAWTPFSELLERLWLADDAQVPLLLQSHRLPQGRDKLILAQAMGWPPLAPWIATCLGRTSWRDAHAQAWFGLHGQDAADGLWPEALNPDSPRHDACWAALRLLHGKGQTQWLEQRLRAGLQGGNAEADINAAWQAALLRLNVDAAHCLPSPLPKLTKALDAAFSAADALVLKASRTKGQAHPGQSLTLPPEAMRDARMIAMLGKPDAPYLGLAQLQDACTPESLAQWARSLYDIWQAEGMPSKARFILPLQGWLGDDATATRLHKGIVLWRSKLDRVRAYDGITALSRMGGNAALTWLSALAEHKRYDDLRTRAKVALQRAAEQRGMDMDELADCTLPDLGFNAQSRQLLDFGPRQFELLLDEHLQLRMRELAQPESPASAPHESGVKAGTDDAPKVQAKVKAKTKAAKTEKPRTGASMAWLKTLPKPRVSDDAELAAHAKRQLKEVQTQLKALGRRQLERMEAAMCSERLWEMAHFRQHLVAHPLARVLTQRLVFGVYPIVASPAHAKPALRTPVAVFRVSADGQPCNADDEAMNWDELAALAGLPLPASTPPNGPANEYESDPDTHASTQACIGIVHPLALAAMPDGEALGQAFAGVLADYELLQPFEQLGREVVHMPADLLAQDRIAQWAGRQLSTGSLLGLMQQGWQREVGDGGMIRALSLPVPSRCGTHVRIDVQFEPGWFVAGGVDTQEGQTLGPFDLCGTVHGTESGTALAPCQAPRKATWHDLSPITRSELMRSLNRLAWWERP